MQVIFIGRFHLELSNINGFIEPVSTIRKLTNPLVMPIKKLLPATVKKFSAIIIAYVTTFIVLIIFIPNVAVQNILIWALIMFVGTWISFLQYGMFLFVIGSWVQIPALQRINYLLYGIFEPMLRPIQRILPSFGGLDFSPIVFLLLLSVASSAFSQLVSRIFY